MADRNFFQRIWDMIKKFLGRQMPQPARVLSDFAFSPPTADFLPGVAVPITVVNGHDQDAQAMLITSINSVVPSLPGFTVTKSGTTFTVTAPLPGPAAIAPVSFDVDAS